LNPPTTYQYDARGRLQTSPIHPRRPTRRRRPSTLTTAWGACGRLRTGGNITTKSYDAVGRLSSVTDAVLPTGNTTTYAYDLNGNLKTITDAAQHTTSFQYDALNRRSKRTL